MHVLRVLGRRNGHYGQVTTTFVRRGEWHEDRKEQDEYSSKFRANRTKAAYKAKQLPIPTKGMKGY